MQKDLIAMKVFQKYLGGYFFEVTEDNPLETTSPKIPPPSKIPPGNSRVLVSLRVRNMD